MLLLEVLKTIFSHSVTLLFCLVFAGLGDQLGNLEQSGDVLEDIMQNHVALGMYVAADLEEGMVITMMNGRTYEVTIDPELMVGPAGFIKTDILVSNGVLQ